MSPSPWRILIAEPRDFSPRALGLLEATSEVELREVGADELHAALRACDVFWFRLRHRIGRAELEGASVRVLATPVTGLDHIDLEACAEFGVKVISLRGEVEFLRQVRATAEHTIGLTLALLRRVAPAVQATSSGEWDRDLYRGRELYEKTCGLVGVGRLGTITADLFRAFGARVIGYDPRPDFPATVDRVDSLDELFERSDVISVHASYSDATHHLIGASQFERARPGAVLVNTARGGILDEVALLHALKDRQIAGAALDVVANEWSFGPAHPLAAFARESDALIVTPHIGGNTYESFEKTETFVAERVVQALSSLPR